MNTMIEKFADAYLALEVAAGSVRSTQEAATDAQRRIDAGEEGVELIAQPFALRDGIFPVWDRIRASVRDLAQAERIQFDAAIEARRAA